MTFETFAQDVAGFVKRYEDWAPFIVAALAFGESLAFISVLIPATAALVAIGALVGAGNVSLIPIVAGAAVGAALGDWLSYWLGITFKDKVKTIWPLSRYPDLLTRGHAYVEKYGIYAIFIGRFFGPLRATVPLAAGILEMPFWPFQLANVASAIVWAALLLAPGYFGVQALF